MRGARCEVRGSRTLCPVHAQSVHNAYVASALNGSRHVSSRLSTISLANSNSVLSTKVALRSPVTAFIASTSPDRCSAVKVLPRRVCPVARPVKLGSRRESTPSSSALRCDTATRRGAVWEGRKEGRREGRKNGSVYSLGWGDERRGEVRCRSKGNWSPDLSPDVSPDWR